ncbi:hypothetical protein DAI22_02g169700 [Oryza sativa Japonica Group]|nr:hypothetical protein DAI22_02g169700 [Oryza sativa Japonica Group]
MIHSFFTGPQQSTRGNSFTSSKEIIRAPKVATRSIDPCVRGACKAVAINVRASRARRDGEADAAARRREHGEEEAPRRAGRHGHRREQLPRRRRLHRVEARHHVAVHHGHGQEHRERQRAVKHVARAQPVPVVPRRRRRAGAGAGAGVDEAEAAAGRDEAVAHGARGVAVAVGEAEQEAAERAGADEAGGERAVGGRAAAVRGEGRREHLEREHGAGREVLREVGRAVQRLADEARLRRLRRLAVVRRREQRRLRLRGLLVGAGWTRRHDEQEQCLASYRALAVGLACF